MKKNVSAYLKTQFSHLNEVNFARLHELGITNINLMTNYLKQPDSFLKKRTQEVEKELKDLNNHEPFDVFTATELGAELAALRARLGNKKIAESTLRSLCSKADVLPALPILRDSSHFSPGEDVVIYTGEYTETDSKNTKWEYAKVLASSDHPGEQEVSVFCINRVTETGSLDGHYYRRTATTPLLFKVSEFIQVRALIEADENAKFLNIFFSNCEQSINRYTNKSWDDKTSITQLIMDESGALITEKIIEEYGAVLVQKALHVSKEACWFVNEAEQMAKNSKIITA